MQKTIYRSKIILPILSTIAKGLIRFGGWKVVGQLPKVNKYIIIAAPHTSNWDFYWCMLAAISQRWEINWVGKKSLFKGFSGSIMAWLGGLPVDRKNASNVVQAYCDLIEKEEKINIVIAPEGTRSLVEKWKSGFYRIAIQSDIPIALGFVDFAKKEVGIGILFKPCGDYEKDMKIILSFYENKKAKYPEKYGFKI